MKNSYFLLIGSVFFFSLFIFYSYNVDAVASCECFVGSSGNTWCNDNVGAGFVCDGNQGCLVTGGMTGECIPGDITGPTVSVSHSPLSPTSSQTVTYTATASDTSGIYKIEIYVDGGPPALPKAQCFSVTSCSYTTSSSYVAGTTHSYYAFAVDNSVNFNSGTTATNSFLVTSASDTTAPTFSGLSPSSGSSIQSPVTFTATASDTSGIKNMNIYVVQPTPPDAIVKTCTFATPTTTVTCTSSSITLSNSPYSYYVKATDNSANSNVGTSSTTSFTVSPGADTSPPTCTGSCGLTQAPTSGSNSATLNWNTATDSNSFFYRIYRKTSAITSPAISDLIYEASSGTTSYTDTNVYAPNAYYYVVRARDSAGNEETNLQQGSTDVSPQPSSGTTYEAYPIWSGADNKVACDCSFTSAGTTPSCNAPYTPSGCTSSVSSCSGTKDISCTCGNVQLTPLPGFSCTSPSAQTNTRTCKWGYISSSYQDNTYSGGFLFNSQGYSGECRIDDHMGTGLSAGTIVEGSAVEEWTMLSCKRTNGAQNVFSISRISDDISCTKSLLTDNTVYTLSGACNKFSNTIYSGYCVKTCTTNTDCPSDLACLTWSKDATKKVCDSCSTSADCDSGETCSAGRCVANSNPTCTLSAATTTAGTNVAMTATSTDANNDVLTYTCSASSGATCTAPASGIPGSISVTAGSATAGTYTVTLNVNDGNSGTGSCTGTLTVNACGAIGQTCCSGTCTGTNVCVSGTCYKSCTLNSASITAGTGCSGSYCQKGDKITLTANYEGACLNAITAGNGNLQIDAKDAATATCLVDYSSTATGNMDVLKPYFNKGSLTFTDVLSPSTTIITSADAVTITNDIPNKCITKQVYGFSAGLRGNTPDNQLISTSGKSDTDTDAGIKLNSPVGGNIILGCGGSGLTQIQANTQCSNWATGAVCDTGIGSCECPSGFRKEENECRPSFPLCYEGDKTTQQSTNPGTPCQSRWRTPTSQSGLYWVDAKKHADRTTSNDNCFANIDTVKNQQPCLFESESASIEYGTYKDVNVYDINGNQVS